MGIGASQWLQREEAAARLRSAYEVQLTKVKGYRRTWAAPRCYVSHVDEQSEQAKELIKDLREAGVYIVDQAEQIQSDDFIIVLDTRAYQHAFKSGASVLARAIQIINTRLGKRQRQLISLALTGHSEPHEFENCQLGSFCDETHYPVGLFDLVLTLYAIPLTHAGFAPLRQTLHAQWEQTLAHTMADNNTSPLRIFISYSREDETFKNQLVKILKGLQRRGVVDTWQDRRIEPGDEWNKSIRDAMNECDLAVLLVSPDYIASDFIQQVEQPTLLQRRQDMQTRIIPIIIRPCPWESEPVLKDLQVLPKDGKAVITFSESTGERDQVWKDIANAIEERAKARS
jgi:TIR domain